MNEVIAEKFLTLFTNNTVKIDDNTEVLPIKLKLDNIVINPSVELKQYECTVCCDYLVIDLRKIEVYQCRNGHYVCLDCWKRSLERRQQCVECNINISSIKELSRNIFIENHFQEKLVRCPYSMQIESNNNNKNNLCKEDYMSFEVLMNQHLKDCQHVLLKCKCNSIFQRKDLKKHQIEDCPLSKITCKYCNRNDIEKNQLDSHYSEECEKVLIDCINNCNERIERSKQSYHNENECKEYQVQCGFPECNIKLTREKMLYHSTVHINSFNQIINQLNNSWKEKLDQNEKKFNSLKLDYNNTLKKLELKVNNLELDNKKLLLELSNNKINNNNICSVNNNFSSSGNSINNSNNNNSFSLGLNNNNSLFSIGLSNSGNSINNSNNNNSFSLGLNNNNNSSSNNNNSSVNLGLISGIYNSNSNNNNSNNNNDNNNNSSNISNNSLFKSIIPLNDTYQNEWTISNFIRIYDCFEHKEAFSSNNIYIQGLLFNIKIYPLGTAGNKGKLSVYVYSLNSFNVKVYFTFQIINSDPLKSIFNNFEYEFESNNDNFGWSNVINTKELVKRENGWLDFGSNLKFKIFIQVLKCEKKLFFTNVETVKKEK